MCPRCHSTSVRRSRITTIRDVVMRWFHMRPYRCRDCNRRFYVAKEVDQRIRREQAWRAESSTPD